MKSKKHFYCCSFIYSNSSYFFWDFSNTFTKNRENTLNFNKGDSYEKLWKELIV